MIFYCFKRKLICAKRNASPLSYSSRASRSMLRQVYSQGLLGSRETLKNTVGSLRNRLSPQGVLLLKIKSSFSISQGVSKDSLGAPRSPPRSP